MRVRFWPFSRDSILKYLTVNDGAIELTAPETLVSGDQNVSIKR